MTVWNSGWMCDGSAITNKSLSKSRWLPNWCQRSLTVLIFGQCWCKYSSSFITWQSRFLGCQDILRHPRVLWLLLRQRGLDSRRASCQKLSDTTTGAACRLPSCGGHLVLSWHCTFSLQITLYLHVFASMCLSFSLSLSPDTYIIYRIY